MKGFTYQHWEDYMRRGRKKYERTLYDRGMYIRKENKWATGGDLIIYPKYNQGLELIRIHPDDTITINCEPTNYHGWLWNPLRSQAIRLSLYRYAGVDVSIKKGIAHIKESNAQRKPVKIQRCRMCKGSGLVDSYCYSRVCYSIVNGKCEKHPEDEIPPLARHHIAKCGHGMDQAHMVPKSQQCYSCGGAGMRDYGSQFITVPWDGSPLKVKDGNIYKQPLTELERRSMLYAQLNSEA